mgnify:CR=1 FL=1
MTLSPVAYLDRRLGRHSGRGPEYVWWCPACIDRVGSESRYPKLNINVVVGIGHCFRCGFAFGGLEKLFRYINNGALRIEEARLLRRDVELDQRGAVASVMRVVEHAPKVDAARPVGLPEEYVPLWERPVPVGCHRALRYCYERGLTDEAIEEHAVGTCATGRYAGYLVFPVIQRGEVAYFTTRFAGQRTPKSRNPVSEDGQHTKATCLLGYDRVVGAECVSVVEGPFDSIAFDRAVALMGKVISKEQVALIADLVPSGLREVCVALDADAGREAETVYRRLHRVAPSVSILRLASGDPWDNRGDIPRLLAERSRSVTAVSMVLSRCVSHSRWQ